MGAVTEIYFLRSGIYLIDKERELRPLVPYDYQVKIASQEYAFSFA